MSDYESIIGTKVVHYLDSFQKTHQNDDYSMYFMENGDSLVYFEQCCTLLSHFQSINENKIDETAKNLAMISSKYKLPYIILHNFLERFENAILCDALKEGHSSSLSYLFLKQITIASQKFSKCYLSGKIEEFIDNNNCRIKTIEELVDSETIHFFEGHLIWLNALAKAVENLDVYSLPELCPSACILGQWLHSKGKQTIVDQERWQHLNMLHNHLHHVAKRMEVLMRTTPIDYHYLLLLLEKADHIALSMGIDLTLISNIEYIKASSKDPLTGVLNRQLLDKIFKTQFELSKSLDTGFALIIGDIDDFKKVNDQYGHVFGDYILKEFAHILTDSIRKSDFVIRFGGEEFILILPVTTLSEAEKIANNICNTFATKSIDKNGDSLYISASFGVSYIHPEIDESSSKRHISELIDEVDQKLLMAKKSGKNKVVA